MNHILDFDEENLTITVEPGVVTAKLTKQQRIIIFFYAGDHLWRYFFIGRNVAENAGGISY